MILLPALALAWWLRRGRVSAVTLAFRLCTATLIVHFYYSVSERP